MEKYGLNQLREMFLSFLKARGISACQASRSFRRMMRACCS